MAQCATLHLSYSIFVLTSDYHGRIRAEHQPLNAWAPKWHIIISGRGQPELMNISCIFYSHPPRLQFPSLGFISSFTEEDGFNDFSAQIFCSKMWPTVSHLSLPCCLSALDQVLLTSPKSPYFMRNI